MLSGFCSFYGTKVLLFFEMSKCFGKKVQDDVYFLLFWRWKWYIEIANRGTTMVIPRFDYIGDAIYGVSTRKHYSLLQSVESMRW